MSWEQQEVMRLLRNQPGTAYQEFDAEHRQIFRDFIRGLLQDQSAQITFVKADGSERQMQCTLNWDMIPEAKHPKSTIVKESVDSKEPETLRVFDLDISEWRSFRYDRVKSIGATIEFDK